MSDLELKLALRRLVAAWSDRWEAEAAKFADNHRDLLPRRITNAQLYGLVNVVRNVRRYSDIGRFIDHQAEKAGRAGRTDVQGYWSDLGKVLGRLKGEAQNLIRQASPSPESDPQKTLDALHHTLTEAYVQHLIAHSLYWTPEAEER